MGDSLWQIITNPDTARGWPIVRSPTVATLRCTELLEKREPGWEPRRPLSAGTLADDGVVGKSRVTIKSPLAIDDACHLRRRRRTHKICEKHFLLMIAPGCSGINVVASLNAVFMEVSKKYGRDALSHWALQRLLIGLSLPYRTSRIQH